MEFKRLTLLSGHYGSGKTNLALNLAFRMKEQGLPVTVADLDIVNPYFRTTDSEDELLAAGIPLVRSKFAGSNLDAPAMPAEIYSVVEDTSRYGVLDIGGDDRGALALGRYVPFIRSENNYEMLMVLNLARPLTRTPEDACTVLHEIETACGLPFTGIVNNTNLGPDTEPEDILASVPKAERMSEMTGLPVVFTSVRSDLAPALEGRIPDLFPISIQKLYYMLNR